MADKIRNVGPKSAAWVRQVGVRTTEDLVRVGPVESFLKVKRAGFRPSLHRLYAMAGAIADCHWSDLSEERKQELLAALGAAESANPIRTRWEKAAAASDRASSRANGEDGEAQDSEAASLFDDPDAGHEGSSGSEGGDGSVSRFD
jgi:hypothetical protein